MTPDNPATPPTYDYTGTTAVTVNYDAKKVTFESNSYYRNSGSGGVGLIDLRGFPRVTFNGELFNRNGDSVKDALNLYASGIMAGATSEMTFAAGLASPGSYSTNL